MSSKDLNSSREPTQWSEKRSIGEAGIKSIRWLQHQPCDKADINYTPADFELSNATWIIKTNRGDMNSTNVYQVEGRNCARHHVLRPLITLQWVGHALKPGPYRHKEVMYFHFKIPQMIIILRTFASRGNFAVLTSYFGRKIITHLRNWWHEWKRIKLGNRVI